MGTERKFKKRIKVIRKWLIPTGRIFFLNVNFYIENYTSICINNNHWLLKLSLLYKSVLL